MIKKSLGVILYLKIFFLYMKLSDSGSFIFNIYHCTITIHMKMTFHVNELDECIVARLGRRIMKICILSPSLENNLLCEFSIFYSPSKILQYLVGSLIKGKEFHILHWDKRWLYFDFPLRVYSLIKVSAHISRDNHR